jgi:hypothetical protein
MLPHGATLLRASIDGVPHALLLEGRTLTVPLTPGDHALSLEWRQPHAPAARFEGPVPTLGLPAVNVSIVAHLPEDRWVLMTRGPPLGPAMLFWPVLALVAALALALGRSRLTPLSAWQWGLLGIGLSQTSVFNAALLAGWLGVFALRARLPPAVSAFRHNAVQLLLAALTLAALSILYAAIRQGLLGAPEMWITGNGSRTGELHWYQDQVGQDLPRVEIWSLPLWIYRVAMLSWSLWLAVALLGWLRWAWQIASRDGLWRPIRLFGRSAPEQAPPAPGVEEHLPATPAA